MIFYLLGCLVALLLLILGGWLVYKFEDCVCITIKEVFICTIFVLLSWLGSLIILVVLLGILLQEYGNRIIFYKRKE